MVTLPHQQDAESGDGGHMVVCGDDALAQRVAVELRDVYRQRVVLLVPAEDADPGGPGVQVVTAAAPTQEALVRADAARATALALVYEDDETNLRAALAARRLSPGLRLVVRMYNRKLGQHLEELLDQAALVAVPGMDRASLDASTTVLSDADTAAPALVATAVVDTNKVVQADGLLLRAAERPAPGRGEVPDGGLCTLALLSSTAADPAGAEGSDGSGAQGPQLLPDDRTVREGAGRGTVVLEAVRHEGPALGARRLARRGVPLRDLVSSQLRWALAGILGAVVALTATTTWLTDAAPVSAAYLTLLDLFSINEPAIEEPTARQVLQLLSGLAGLALLPLLVAGVLEALGTFRSTGALRRPPRGLSDHIVLLGLGKVGARVLTRLRELDIPVVCVEQDADARGIALARDLGVPVVLGDVTEDGVLKSAKAHRAEALLALTSSDTTNLEATLAARSLGNDLRVVLRLDDDDFATAVYRTLRSAHPTAVTRSRSVAHLAAPAFASAMMGRQVLGAIFVERRILLFAVVPVAGHPHFEGRTVAEAFRPGVWRVIALDTARPDSRSLDLAHGQHEQEPSLLWGLHPGHLLDAEDRVVVATTRQGLADLLTPAARSDSPAAP
ncbi:potassium channel family protein [Streptomyces sp. NPDC003860]